MAALIALSSTSCFSSPANVLASGARTLLLFPTLLSPASLSDRFQHRRYFHRRIGTSFRRGERRSIISNVAFTDISSSTEAVGTVRDAELRVRIVEERARFDRDPKGFRVSYMVEQQKLRQQIASARKNLASVQIYHDLPVKISKALAVLKGRDKVTADDIATMIPYCLRHCLSRTQT